jgi:hypothetical protein
LFIVKTRIAACATQPLGLTAAAKYRQIIAARRIVKLMPQQTLPTNQEDREVYLREHDAARFIDSVAASQREKAPVIIMLDAFWREPDLLYVALDYARSSGVDVTLAATTS